MDEKPDSPPETAAERIDRNTRRIDRETPELRGTNQERGVRLFLGIALAALLAVLGVLFATAEFRLMGPRGAPVQTEDR